MEKTKKHRSTFAVLIWLNRSKMKKNGLCPVMGRISIDASRVQFSLKIDAHPKDWDAKQGRLKGSSSEAKTINRTIEGFIKDINSHYAETLAEHGCVTPELVKNALTGVSRKAQMLLELFAEHNDEYKLRVGVNRVKASYEHYLLSYRVLQNFIKHKYNVNDVSLKSLNLGFIDAYDFYLRVERRMSAHTISNHVIILKKMTKRAVNQNILKRDPFGSYKAEQPEKKCRHLKADEIDKIMQIEIESESVRYTRDMFVFSCFTGLSYSDLCNLSEKHIVTESDGSLWIKINRQKTGSECNIKLLEIPLLIMEKYRHGRKNGKLFSPVSSSHICVHMRKLEKLTGIKHITFHMSRHNFATHITLSRGVPIETVCRMMGHQSIVTTAHYAKITNQKVNEDMKILAERITDRYSVFEDESVFVGIKRN